MSADKVQEARRYVMNVLGRLAEIDAMPNDAYRRDFRAKYDANERLLDALIAAVRKDEKARCIAAVSNVTRYANWDTDFIVGMQPDSEGEWIDTSDAMEAIRDA